MMAISSRFLSGRAVQSYTKAIEQHAKGHLVDLGCGNAPLYGAYSPLVDHITCIDWPGSLHTGSHVDLFADLNHPIALSNEQFDTILSTSVLEHIWRHDVMWAEMARLLKSDGKIILGIPFYYHLHEQPYDFFRWTSFALERACAENDLHVISLEPFGGPLDAVADIMLKISQRYGSVTKALNKVATLSLSKGPLRRLSDRASKTMPLGYVLVAQKR